MGIFMVYAIYIYIYIYLFIYLFLFFLFLDCTRFGFELVSQNLCKMKILKMTHFTYLVIFNFKVIVCQNVSLSHTYGIAPKNTHL